MRDVYRVHEKAPSDRGRFSEFSVFPHLVYYLHALFA